MKGKFYLVTFVLNLFATIMILFLDYNTYWLIWFLLTNVCTLYSAIKFISFYYKVYIVSNIFGTKIIIRKV